MAEALIHRLADDLRPAPPGWMLHRFALGLGLGVAGSALFMTLALGLRPDLAKATGTTMFWVKLGYALAIGLLALWAVERFARPGANGMARALWIALPTGVVAVLAWSQLSAAPASARHLLVMGKTARFCPGLIAVCALPCLAGLVWAVRGMAPTRLRTTGALIGLVAGGLGAAVYSFHCIETGAPFLVLWYSLGICAAALLGLLSGPRLLRW